MELFLAKLFGVYLIIVGAVVLVRRRSFMPAVRDLASNRALLMVMSVIELAAGLAVVLAYPKVSLEPVGIISLVGWGMLVEGFIYLALPARKVQHMISRFNITGWYVAGGALAVAGGIYLANFGFGLGWF